MNNETITQATELTLGPAISIEEQRRDFAQHNPVNKNFWEKMSDLTILQATLYTFDIDPGAIQEYLNAYAEPVSTDELPDEFLNRLSIIKSAVRVGAIDRIPSAPSGEVDDDTRIVAASFLKWHKTNGGIYTNEKKPGDLSTKERETLLKIIIGMAIDGYSYDPTITRSPFTGSGTDSLHAQLATHGISIDPDTIRKYINEAKDLLPPKN